MSRYKVVDNDGLDYTLGSTQQEAEKKLAELKKVALQDIDELQCQIDDLWDYISSLKVIKYDD